MKKVIILREIHVAMKSSKKTKKETVYSHFRCRFITYSIRIGSLDWCK